VHITTQHSSDNMTSDPPYNQILQKRFLAPRSKANYNPTETHSLNKQYGF